MLVQLSLLGEDTHRSFQRRLMMLLAAIEGGSSEALLWLIPLEGVLKDISKQALRCDHSDITQGRTARVRGEVRFSVNCVPLSTRWHCKTSCHAHIRDEIARTQTRRGMSRSGMLSSFATILVAQTPAVFDCSGAPALSQRK